MVLFISIHALLAESDHPNHRAPWDQHRFLSTLSLRRATASRLRRSSPKLYFYPRSPCGERPSGQTFAYWYIISIHALLAESDRFSRFGRMTRRYFYPRSPCGERPPSTETITITIDFYPRSPCGERPVLEALSKEASTFLSTLSLRRATAKSNTFRFSCIRFLSTLSLRRATTNPRSRPRPLCNFYPRSPCGERRVIPEVFHDGMLFLSTLSLRRATF